MGANYRRRERCVEIEEEEITFFEKIKNLLFKAGRVLPDLIPYLVAGIVACIFASYVQMEYNKENIKKMYTKISNLTEIVNSRLEDMEKLLLEMAIKCGLSDSGNGNGDSMEDLIKLYIRKYDSDKTGMIDWAVESLGGCILGVKDAESYPLGESSILGIPCFQHASDPRAVISPSTMPGNCWAFKGQSGTVIVKLASSVFITNITLEHVPKEMTPKREITSAPKLVVVNGVRSLDDKSPHRFGVYEYKANGDPVQTFPVQFTSYEPYNIIEFSFKSNHGNKEYTCVYRVRVHGQITIDSTCPEALSQ